MRDWTVAAASVAFGAACTYAILRGNPDDAGQGSSQNGTTTLARFEPDAFLAAHPNAVHWPWNTTGDPTAPGAVAGEAYFDPATGEGALVIEGLAPNDPAREQYQLWIFDRTRDERFPVDGGVFDVRREGGRDAATAGRTVIAIRAQLPVREPYLFAITVERPGGTVVSERRIAMLAKP